MSYAVSLIWMLSPILVIWLSYRAVLINIKEKK